MRAMKTFTTAVAATMWAISAYAQIKTAAVSSPDPAGAFGARESARGAAISPDGSALLFLGPITGDRSALMVADLADGSVKVALTDRGSPFRLTWCQWKSEARIICALNAIEKLSGDLIGVRRTVALDRDGGRLRELGMRGNERSLGINQSSGQLVDLLPDDPENVLMAMQMEGEFTTGTMIADDRRGLSVQRVNVLTGSRTIVEPPRGGADFFQTDGPGRVRLMALTQRAPGEQIKSRMRLSARAATSGTWRPIGEYDRLTGAGLNPEGFDATGDWVLGLKSVNGRDALVRVAADGSGREEPVFAHDRVDVDGVLRIGKYGRPVAAQYTLDTTHYEYFDPAIAKLSASLTRALPGKGQVDILDETWDGTKKLVRVGGDTDPGRYYLYSSSTRKLEELVSVRPLLDGQPLAEVKPVRYAAADGTMIPAYLTLPPGRADAKGLPAIVMPHGGPAARDQRGFDWWAQFYAARGYAVLQPNFRGSAGYGDAWFVENGFRSWPIAIGDINAGARWMAKEGIADPARLAIVGWSYGGYAALQANVVDPGLYKAAVAVAPVTDLAQLKEDARGFTNFNLVSKYVGAGPHVAAGSPTVHARAITAPVILFHGDRDLNVDIDQSRRMASALKSAGRPAELVVYPGLDHQLDDSAARADMLRRTDAFLAKALGPGTLATR